MLALLRTGLPGPRRISGLALRLNSRADGANLPRLQVAAGKTTLSQCLPVCHSGVRSNMARMEPVVEEVLVIDSSIYCKTSTHRTLLCLSPFHLFPPIDSR